MDVSVNVGRSLMFMWVCGRLYGSPCGGNRGQTFFRGSSHKRVVENSSTRVEAMKLRESALGTMSA